MRNWTLAGARPANLAIPRVRTFATLIRRLPLQSFAKWSRSGPGHMDSPDRAKALVLRAPSSPTAILHTRPGGYGPTVHSLPRVCFCHRDLGTANWMRSPDEV